MQPVEEYGKTREELLEMEAEQEQPSQSEEDKFWLGLSRDAYETSDTFFGTSLGKQIEKNLHIFNNKHPAGSKYHLESYKHRSKLFRPKTRSSLRSHEASAAIAYFSTDDIVISNAVNQGDPEAVLGAEISERLLNLRLRDPKMKWFMTCLGAYQDTMVQGAVASKQEWLFKESPDEKQLEGLMSEGEDGFQASGSRGHEIFEDRPIVDTIPIENIRIDPNSDWRNPVEDSPYVIELIPMYAYQVKELMGYEGKDISKRWRTLSDGELTAGDQENYTTQGPRKARNDNRVDATDQQHANSDFNVIWVHRNIVRVDGQDFVYFTLRNEKLLSEPVLLSEVCPHGRNYVIGVCNLESHKTIPASPVELLESVQREINELANQRMDNVKLAVNRRTFVKRQAQIDTRGLMHSVPGGVTFVDDINEDVRYDAPPDVTASSFQEHDRLNIDFDELSGSFSNSSVQANRAMNETVGGMEIMTADSNSVKEYQLRIFAETWVKPVLRQLLDLERHYESDMEILRNVSGGMDPVKVIQLLRKEIAVGVSIGFGATSPQKRIEKLSYGLQTVAGFVPKAATRINEDTVITEVFGALGYQDGKRFFDQEGGEDPKIAELTQMVQQLQQALQSKQMDIQGKVQVAQIKAQGDMQREQIKSQALKEIAYMNQQIGYIDKQIAAEKNEVKREELMIAREAFEFTKKEKQFEIVNNERNRMSDVLLNQDYGNVPFVDEGEGKG